MRKFNSAGFTSYYNAQSTLWERVRGDGFYWLPHGRYPIAVIIFQGIGSYPSNLLFMEMYYEKSKIGIKP